MASEAPVGVFDSGVGGLTVLHECLVSLPAEDFLYFGDSGHFPYGTKTTEQLRERVDLISDFLFDRGIEAADRWLHTNRHHIGQRSTLDLVRAFGV